MSEANPAPFLRLEEALAHIETLDSGGPGRLQRSLLYFPILDILGSILHPREGRSGVKVRKLVWAFGEWPEQDRVSAVLVARLLERHPEPPYQAARAELRRRLEAWPRAGPVPLSLDPEFEELRGLLGGHAAVGPYKLQRFRHIQLLWDTRNALLQNLDLLPGPELNLLQSETPHYLRIDRASGPADAFLGPLFPEGFLQRLTATCLLKLRGYCSEHAIDAEAVLAASAAARWPAWLPAGA